MNLLIIKGIYFEAVFKDRADVQKLNRIKKLRLPAVL